MPSKRKKHQSIDHYAGALKAIMKNKEGFSAAQLSLMLEAAKMLAVLDEIPIPRLTGDSGQPAPTVDPLLERLKERVAQGGANATA